MLRADWRAFGTVVSKLELQVRIEMEYQFGHSMFSQRLYKQIKDTCKFPTPTQAGWLPPPGCQALIDQLHTQSGAKFWDNPK